MWRVWAAIIGVCAAPFAGYALGGWYGGVVTTVVALLVAERYSPRGYDPYVGGE